MKQWLTGEDGRPAFYKIAYLAVLLAFFAVTVACIVRNIVLDALPWLVTWATVMLMASHGKKGIDQLVKALAHVRELKAAKK